MELNLTADHPLAQAVQKTFNASEVWLVLKAPADRETYFRAVLKRWELHKDGSAVVEFESWEEYMERKAQLAGL